MPLTFGPIPNGTGESQPAPNSAHRRESGEIFRQALTDAEAGDLSTNHEASRFEDQRRIDESKLASEAALSTPPEPAQEIDANLQKRRTAFHLDDENPNSEPIGAPTESDISIFKKLLGTDGRGAMSSSGNPNLTSQSGASPANQAGLFVGPQSQWAQGLEASDAAQLKAEQNSQASIAASNKANDATLLNAPNAQSDQAKPVPADELLSEQGASPGTQPQGKLNGLESSLEQGGDNIKQAGTTTAPSQPVPENPLASTPAPNDQLSPVESGSDSSGGQFNQEHQESGSHEQSLANRSTSTIASDNAAQVMSDQPIEVKSVESLSQPAPAAEKSIAQDELMKQVKLNIRTGSSRINFLVDPPELGRLDIQLVVKNGRLTGQITAESTAIQKVLADGLKALQDAMREAGLNVESFEIKTNEQSTTSHEQPSAPDEGRGEWSQRNRNRSHEKEIDATRSNESAESKTEVEATIDGSLNIIA